MRRAKIGSLEVSAIGLGCNNFGRALDQEASTAVVEQSLDCGIDYFDTADNYGNGQSERFLAKALGARRKDVVIATKFGMDVTDVEDSGGAQADYVRRAVTRSLEQLQTDWIDLYQLHKPDPKTPIAETLGVLSDLAAEGLVRQVGCSNLDAAQLREALDAATGSNRFVSNQVEYSLLHRDPQTNGLRDVALAERTALLPFYPLACGLLTGKVERGAAPTGRLSMDRYQRFLVDQNFDVVDQLRPFAEERGLSMAQVALGWLVAQPEVPSVTPGATRPDQVIKNVAAAEWEPTTDDLAFLDGLSPT